MPRKTSMYFEDLAEEYLIKYAKRNKKSWRQDEIALNNYWLPAFSGRMIHTISRRDIVEALENFRTNPVSGKKELGPVINRYLASVRKMFNWAISQALTEDNPCKMVGKPVKDTKRDRVLEMAEFDLILEALEKPDIGIGPEMRKLIKLLILTSARRSEVCGMRWREVSLKRGTWTIPAERSKNGSTRSIPLSRQAVEILGTIPQKGTYVFRHRTKRYDGHLSPDSINHAVNKIRNHIGITDWRPHDLRRSAGTHMRRLGCDHHTLKLILGHTLNDVTSIYDRYDAMEERTKYLQLWADELDI